VSEKEREKYDSSQYKRKDEKELIIIIRESG